ncbi:MAG: U32 family peptidase [Clostridia bacterium]|nr:U32 family peptidase [Clostridia bacterium]
MTELLSPAGSMESLQTALYFGADAVYLGGPQMQLRAASSAFTFEQIASAVAESHGKNKKVYVTVNAFMRDTDVTELKAYVKELYSSGVDALIVSDIGAISVIKETEPDMEIHISTQANCMNSEAAKVYYRMGAKRIVAARELSLDEIARIRQSIPDDMEIEAFVHGAMCMSYSGRCMISAFLNDRSANRGDCTQPCRWKYHLVEETRPGIYIPVEEDGKGAYILSSYDLNCASILDRMKEAGICSFKIEGRMKSAYYVAAVTNAYRKALDRTDSEENIMRELDAVSHRPYATGFYVSSMKDSCFNEGTYVSTKKFIAVVKQDLKDGSILVEQRNRFEKGDTLEILSPFSNGQSFKVEKIEYGGEETDKADLPVGVYRINCPFEVRQGDILRKNI